MTTEDLEDLLGKKILGVGYERTVQGYVLVLFIKNKEFYLCSEEPIELEVRDIH